MLCSQEYIFILKLVLFVLGLAAYEFHFFLSKSEKYGRKGVQGSSGLYQYITQWKLVVGIEP